MLLWTYIIGLTGSLVLVAMAVRQWGKAPTLREIVLGLIGGLLMGVLVMIFTLVLNREGNSSRIPILMLAGSWALFTSVRPLKRAGGLVGVLFFLLFILSFQHLALATSHGFTDNPEARDMSWIVHNRHAEEKGIPLIPELQITATPHTWLTGLYRVEPPFGGRPGRAAVSPPINPQTPPPAAR